MSRRDRPLSTVSSRPQQQQHTFNPPPACSPGQMKALQLKDLHTFKLSLLHQTGVKCGRPSVPLKKDKTFGGGVGGGGEGLPEYVL